jgi:hypothetical protein
MELIAHSVEEALRIAAKNTSLGNGFPVYVIPVGMGNIAYEHFLCYGKTEVERIWEEYIFPVETPAFRRAHIIHCPRPYGPK